MTSSKLRAFSARDVQNAQPWKLPDVSGKILEQFSQVDGVTESESDAQASLTVDAIETFQQQAYDEAFVEGKQQGMDFGAKEGHKEGYQVGFEEGLQDGKKQGHEQYKQQLEQQIEQIKGVLTSLSEPLQSLDEQIELELVQLALATARCIVLKEITVDETLIQSALRQALAVLPVAHRKLVLKLNPEDAGHIATALALDDKAADCQVIEDPKITRGGCIVTTENSRIDGTLEKRMQTAIETVLGETSKPSKQ
ncbi:MAG: flagellar assembly protein FliH [Methylococcaceae bacterium]